MKSKQLKHPPYEWIVNSNALGVGFLAKDMDFNISFLSRHAVGRLDRLNLLGKDSDQLVGKPACHLASSDLLSIQNLRDPENYPASFRAVVEDRHIEFAISPVLDHADEYLGVMVTFKDVSEESARQQLAEEFQERMSSLVTEARDRGDEAETAAKELAASMSTVRTSGEEVSRLREQLTLLNEQTALLSLNANIEASRSGSGAAFGVIAGEMRDLAASMQLVADEARTAAAGINDNSARAEASSAAVTEKVGQVIGAQQAMEAGVKSTT